MSKHKDTTTRVTALPFHAQGKVWIAAGALCMAAPAIAAQPSAPTEITIYASGKREPVLNVDPAAPATAYRVDEQGIELFGGAGGTNSYTAVSAMPSVSLDSVDPYGLANMPAGNKGLRVRGEMMPHGGIGTIDGIPLSGIDPGPGFQWLFDAENLSAVSLSEGAIAPDRLSFFTNTGVLDSELKWPTAQRGLQASQSLGSFGLRRSFVRLDSGQLGNGARLMVSASDTASRKWRGPGNAPSARSNFEGALELPFSERFDAKVCLSYNDMQGDNYRPLTYAEASNLGTYNNFDYAATSSATPSQAVHYYGYNRQAFRDWSVFSELGYRLGPQSDIMFKPFYMSEQGNYLDGMATGKVRQWLIDHNWYGMIAEYRGNIGGSAVKLGYWWDTMDPPGPPTAWKLYDPTAGGGLNFASWALLGKTVRRHQFDSLYATADKRFDALKIQAGARYLSEKLPSIEVYNTAGVGDTSYGQALAAASGGMANRSVVGPVFHELLPYLAASYDLSPDATLKLSVGRNYGAPSFDVWPVYQTNATLRSKYTAQQIWDRLRPEISDAIDIGVLLNHAGGYLEPRLFYSKSRNKGVSFVDPAVGVAYPQNAGNTHAYGLQLAGALTLQQDLEGYASFTYERAVFDQDFTTTGGAALAVQGLQLPDTPSLMASLGATYRKGAFSFSPLVHYTGKRYGDALQQEAVPGYCTVDISMGYEAGLPIGKAHATLSGVNLFNRQYIGFINAGYLQNAGQTSYYPGAPRSLVLKLRVDM